jgi:hypothetical protein
VTAASVPSRGCGRARLDEGARVGNFVETKKAQVGAGSKVNHLSYIGDAQLGAGRERRRRHDHLQLRRHQQAPTNG